MGMSRPGWVSKTVCQKTVESRDTLKVQASCGMQGARIEIEGRKRGHYWTFNVVKDGARPGETISLVRCSTESQNTADHWLTVSPPHCLKAVLPLVYKHNDGQALRATCASSYSLTSL